MAPDVLYKLSNLQFPTSLLKPIRSFLKAQNSDSRLKAKCLCQEKYKQGCHKEPSPTLYNLYINGVPQARGVHLALFGDMMLKEGVGKMAHNKTGTGRKPQNKTKI
jgi:hypothetical protein